MNILNDLYIWIQRSYSSIATIISIVGGEFQNPTETEHIELELCVNCIPELNDCFCETI